ncbi:hypothetical protein LEP1GSC047_2874 [Leptospira inadai serovar Lyme str. 10]|uniref:Uncharacterized protein n=1 Tax=Leptospira inadai serovar Lyme str. 10 TaxID=1049790 RepID=V6HAM2_9LEPT|nr:hypothetical protein LEP1GSC047_2874 [Leptospira inadai serovar Lyme str. 10]
MAIESSYPDRPGVCRSNLRFVFLKSINMEKITSSRIGTVKL